MLWIEIVDLLFVVSYLLIVFCFVLLVIPKKVKRQLRKTKELFCCKLLWREKQEDSSIPKTPLRLETIEERREEALDYLVKNYFETKKREEAYLKNLRSYGRFRRWVYKRSRNLKNSFVFVKNSIVKPSMIVTTVYSTGLSLYLALRTGTQISRLTRIYVPHPINYVLDVLILFPLGFSPGLLSIVLGYYIEKEKLERILVDYGVRG